MKIMPYKTIECFGKQCTRHFVFTCHGIKITLRETWINYFSTPLPFCSIVWLHFHVFLFSLSFTDESLTCNVCDRAFKCHRQLASHQQKKRHFGWATSCVCVCVCEWEWFCLWKLKNSKARVSEGNGNKSCCTSFIMFIQKCIIYDEKCQRDFSNFRHLFFLV